MKQRPRRRLTREESDALTAHLSPAEYRRRVAIFIEALRIKGVEAEEFFDAGGKSFIKVDLEQLRAKLGPDAEALFQQIAEIGSLPEGHTPPAA